MNRTSVINEILALAKVASAVFAAEFSGRHLMHSVCIQQYLQKKVEFWVVTKKPRAFLSFQGTDSLNF